MVRGTQHTHTHREGEKFVYVEEKSQLNVYECEKYFVFIFNSTLVFKQRFMCCSDDVDGRKTTTQSYTDSLVHHP